MTKTDEKSPVLVIGGAGYIGSVLVGRMLKRGFRVRVLDKLLYDNEAALAEYRGHPDLEFTQGDLCDAFTVERALDDVGSVVLLAALVGDPVCKKHPELAVKINYEGTIRLYDSLDGRGLGRFVFMSTCSNYGLRTDDEEATEEAVLNPQSLYAETKVGVEKHILSTAERVDFSPVILRAATAYGVSPRMRFDLTVNEFTREMALGNELLVYDAETWRPYCHVEDIAEAITSVLAAGSDEVSGEVFNVGSPGENYTKKMIVDLLLREIVEGKVRYKEGSVDPRNYRVSFEKVSRCLGFQPSHNISMTVRELVDLFGSGEFDDFAARKHFYNNCLA